MKKVLKLSDQMCSELNELYENSKINRVRRRSHIILLSNKDKSIKDICSIFQIHRDTVSAMIDSYNEFGIGGLFDKYRSGRPVALTPEEENFILKEVDKDSRSLKNILFLLEDKFQKKICKTTLIRFLKKKSISGNDFVNH